VKGLIFTFALCYGGAVVSLFNPFVGLLIYVCFAIIKPDSLWFWSVPQGNYSRIIAVALLLGWAREKIRDWRFGKAAGIAAVFAALWLWSVVSALAAPDQERAWFFVETVFKILLPFVVGLSLIDSVRKLKQLTWVIVLSQGYLAFEFNQYYLFQGVNYVRAYGFAGMEEGSIAIGMVTALSLAIYLILESDAWWQKAAAFFIAGCLVHVVLLSFSRGGMLALVSVAVVTLILVPKRPTNLALLAAGGLIALSLSGKEVIGRFETTFQGTGARDSSAQSRLELWGNCWDAMLHHPLVGVGPNHFPLVAHTQYGWPHEKEGHSIWLQMGAELGVPGFLCLIAFYALGVRRLWPIARGKAPVPDPWLPVGARMVVTATIGFAVAAQFISLWALELPYYAMLIGAAVIKLQGAPEPELRGAALAQTPHEC
jgi:probable O-glycosylation ligase (exosortase A-associated)